MKLINTKLTLFEKDLNVVVKYKDIPTLLLMI